MTRLMVFALSFLSYQMLFSQSKTSFRFSSYNFENFWDNVPTNTKGAKKAINLTLPEKERPKITYSLQYSSYDKRYSNWYSQYVLDAKIENVLQVLRLSKTPDIVALQEIESAENKSTVFDTPYKETETFRSKLAELGYKYIYLGQQEEENPVSVTTAFISKVELEILEQVKIKSPGYSSSARDLQVAVLNLENERVLLVNNHWKSKRNGGEETRVATARSLAQRIDLERENPKKTHVIVLGDLNTAYYEKPLEALGVTNDKTIFNKDKSSPLLYNLWYDVAPKDRWESSFNGVRDTLSHILISGSLLDRTGFDYEDGSFEVIGHKEPEKSVLINVSGQPFRWQLKFYYDWHQHIGKGYSDHLPLVATFNFTPQKNLTKKFSKKRNPHKPKEIFFNEIEPCSEKESINLLRVRNQSEEDLDRKCVKLEIESFEEPLAFKTRGKYSQNYITIPLISRGARNKTLTLGLTMPGRYDWRPNIHDKRISYEEASIPKGFYHDGNWHPRSNKCFVRKVLQRKGGALRKVFGRIGYADGYLSIHVTSREDIVLEDLPQKKREACPWF